MISCPQPGAVKSRTSAGLVHGYPPESLGVAEGPCRTRLGRRPGRCALARRPPGTLAARLVQEPDHEHDQAPRSVMTGWQAGATLRELLQPGQRAGCASLLGHPVGPCTSSTVSARPLCSVWPVLRPMPRPVLRDGIRIACTRITAASSDDPGAGLSCPGSCGVCASGWGA